MTAADGKKMTVETKTSGIHNWLAERLSKPLDRLWLGGVVAVNVLVWAFLGAQYIATFLIGYFFVFALCFRAPIKISFPPTRHIVYMDSSALINPHVPLDEKIRRASLNAVVPLLSMYLVAIVIESGRFSFSPASAGIWAANALANYFFLIRHKEFLRGFTGDCLIFRRTGSGDTYRADAGNITWQDSFCNSAAILFQILRPVGAVTVTVLLWCGLLWAFITGQIAAVFDSYHSFIAPIVINFALFIIVEFSLLSLEEKS